MELMTTLLIVWGGLTAVLVILLIYRSTLNMHEDDQLFLDEAESHMAKDQEQLLVKINRLTPWVRIFGTCSALLIVVIAGLLVYGRLNQ
ncbi:MAG TPA: hypothetical protein VKY85_15310 [Candidatus Angelobacter sp.]|jgi:hypothetical protein|nr:hypothetical protein [Candidatus Angelobacter sp.]